MSYPSPGSYQIDVIDQVGRAYRVTLDHARLAVEMALLPYAIVLAAALIALAAAHGGLFGWVLAAGLNALALLVFGAVFLVRWHRFVLLGETVGGGPMPPGWTAFLIALIKLGAAMVVVWLALVLLAVLPPHFVTAPLSIIGGVALGFVALRVSLVFPAAAIERPIEFRTAWDWLAGNFWRFFVCVLACYLPFAVVQLVIGVIGGLFPALFWILFEALRLAVSFAGAAVVAALLSHVYREIAGSQAAPVAQALPG